jgi:uncharacterized protein
MTVPVHHWPAAAEFLDRDAERARLEQWWASPDKEPLSLFGRRRVGKSWLFRRFADGKPAVVLVADRLAAGQQWTNLAVQLEAPLGVRPQIDGIADLFRALYALGRDERVLVVVDELPYLLGTTAAEQQANLSAVQAVMEAERDASSVKLLLTGSAVAQMESLQAERSPLHGRLVPLPLRPLGFAQARLFMPDLDPVDQVTRFALTGGMPRYLRALGRGGLLDTVTTHLMDPLGAFFNEPRTILATELREPSVYFSVLSVLATRPQSVTAIGEVLRMPTNEVTRYLDVLAGLQLVTRSRPVGARPEARNTQWRCEDHFVRFWFRFVQPRQAELEAGADPAAMTRATVPAHLSDHTAPVFEEVVGGWVRQRFAGTATEVGRWWGPAVHASRASRTRFSEEVDVVGLAGRRAVVAVEAKWTNAPLDAGVLTALADHKLPALAQAGLDVTGCALVLASRSGFTDGVRALAAERGDVTLVTATDLVRDLYTRPPQ